MQDSLSLAVRDLSNKMVVRETHCEISAYNDQPMTTTDSAIAIKKLSVAFPNQSNEFFALLAQRMIANKFTAERCADAVNYLIDNFAFKQINISDVIKFDRKRKLYTYGQMLSKLVCNGGTEKDTNSFRKVQIDGQTYWYLPSENL